MNFTLVRGEAARVSEYCEIFLDSKLYDAYFSEPGVLEGWLTRAIGEGTLYIAMSSQGEPIGAMIMEMTGMCGLPYLHLLGVKKKWRGMGVGTGLIKIFIGVVEATDAPNMFIMTSHFNVRAKRLYQSLGFVPQCLLKDVTHKGVSEWLFMRPSSTRGEHW